MQESCLIVVDKAIQEDSIGHLRWAEPTRSHELVQFKACVHTTGFGVALQKTVAGSRTLEEVLI